MRIMVTGGRDYNDMETIRKTLNEYDVERLIHGNCTGADQCANAWAYEQKVPVSIYPADWNKNGRAAGPIRNKRMIDEGRPDLVIAFPGGRGTASAVQLAKAAGVPVRFVGVKP